MNRANDLGDNWIRSAIQEILAKSGLPSLPKDEVVQFIRNTQNDGSSRRAAYEFLSESHPQIAQSLIASFIDDTEPTLRREGVSLLLQEAGQINNKEQSIEAFEYALGKARDVDQIEEASESLKILERLFNFKNLWVSSPIGKSSVLSTILIVKVLVRFTRQKGIMAYLVNIRGKMVTLPGNHAPLKTHSAL